MGKGALFFLLLGGSAAFAEPAFADCASRGADLVAFIKAGDVAGAERAVGAIDAALDCGPKEISAAWRQFDDLLVLEAKRLRADPMNAARADQLVEKAAAQNVSWSAALALGDLQHARHAYAQAAASYQVAIKLIEDEPEADRKKIPRSTLDYLSRRADESRHLAAASANGWLVAAIPGRDSQFGGVFSPVLDRGAVAVRVPAPILFKYNSDAFIPVGQEAAEELAALLKDRVPSVVVVTGHTDHIGSDDFNLKLSKKRAEKVAAFLHEHGVTGTITTVGKGRSEPRVLSDGAAYSQDQIDELNRRVEFDWKQ
jgi:outer membrane protein OmpA-like peptidoglycan-associated protein